MSIDYCGVCDKGNKRVVNQDAILMSAKRELGLFVVADGMGGHSLGEVASGCIVNELRNWWESIIGQEEKFEFYQLIMCLKQKIKEINRRIYEEYNNGTVCGSTVVILLIYKRYFCIVTVGDSRIYRLRGLWMKQMTVDDVWENLEEVKENFDLAEIKSNINYGKLTSAIGIDREVTLKVQTGKLRGGDKFLLCSDGVYKLCKSVQIKERMRKYKGTENGKDIVKRLLDSVYEKGAPDNISAIFLRYLDE